MHKYVTYILLLCVTLVTGSCDFLRRSAGKPTSADIERRRQEIVRVQEREREISDSLELAREALIAYAADSLAVMDSLAKQGCLIHTAGEFRIIQGLPLSSRYWIVTGAFRNIQNTERRIRRMEDAGFKCETIVFGNGVNVVLAAPNERITDLYKDLGRYRSSGLSTPDVWIFDSGNNNVK